MKHYLYKIINIETNQYYIGVRSHKDPQTDKYMGSSSIWTKDWIKENKDILIKEIIDESFQTREDANIGEVDLLQKYEFRITRIRSVWLDDYQGRLRPGWYARVEVFLKGTDAALMFVDGEHSYPEIFCFGFDAVDGRPNQSYP